jgi:hypothetical protein
MFHVSFLVKHYQVILSIGEKGLPVLEVAKRSRHDEEEESSSSEQVTVGSPVCAAPYYSFAIRKYGVFLSSLHLPMMFLQRKFDFRNFILPFAF